jgi:hypothetical protein
LLKLLLVLVVVGEVGLLLVLLQRLLPCQRVVQQTLPCQQVVQQTLQMAPLAEGLLVLLWPIQRVVLLVLTFHLVQLQLGQATSRLFRGPWLLKYEYDTRRMRSRLRET